MDTEGAPRPAGRPHPGARQYLGVAAVLLVVTAVEVAVYYVPAMRPVLVPALLTLAVVKFSLVALFFMHLRMDGRLFAWLFVTPLAIATLLILALMKLFGVI
jgi:cytochrome c oxidase subunit 4